MTAQRPGAAQERHEPSAWLRGALTARAREIDAIRGDEPRVVAYLTPHGDRTCDRCKRTAPAGTQFYADVLTPEPWLVIIAGLCETCRNIEVGKR